MREIKFRILFDGEWYYATLDEICENLGYEYGVPKNVSAFLYEDSRNKTQYIGLKDKNGKEIYEGDIVTGIGNEDSSRIDKHVIEFREGSFGAVWTNKGGYQKFSWFPTYIAFKHKGHPIIEQVEVIGNIYENPELLKEKE